MSLSFSRVAILEPSKIFSLPLEQMTNAQVQDNLDVWLKGFENHPYAPNAIYLRARHAISQWDWIGERLSKENKFSLLVPTCLADLKWGTHLHLRHGQGPAWPTETRPQGKSCHSVKEVVFAAENGCSYAFLSPIFTTQTHPEALPLGLDFLRIAREAVSIPVFALGGISDPEGLGEFAGISLFLRSFE